MTAACYRSSSSGTPNRFTLPPTHVPDAPSCTFSSSLPRGRNWQKPVKALALISLSSAVKGLSCMRVSLLLKAMLHLRPDLLQAGFSASPLVFVFMRGDPDHAGGNE